MIYTQEEKAKMDALLNAFRSYVDRQEHYDVVYSERAGYLRVITGAGCDTIYFPISSFAEMLRMFTDDFLSDEEYRVGHSLKRDYDLCPQSAYAQSGHTVALPGRSLYHHGRNLRCLPHLC